MRKIKVRVRTGKRWRVVTVLARSAEQAFQRIIDRTRKPREIEMHIRRRES